MAAPELGVLVARRRPLLPVAMAALTQTFLDEAQPRAIAFSVFATRPDAFQLLERLVRLGYRGRVLALAPQLPRRTLVERELRSQGPGLRLKIVCLQSLALDP